MVKNIIFCFTPKNLKMKAIAVALLFIVAVSFAEINHWESVLLSHKQFEEYVPFMKNKVFPKLNAINGTNYEVDKILDLYDWTYVIFSEI